MKNIPRKTQVAQALTKKIRVFDRMVVVQDIPIADIVDRNSFRLEMRNIDQLATSISDLGLLQPVVLRSNREIVAGRRRVAAFRALGRDTIPAIVVENLDDERNALLAEAEENTQREPFSPAEIVLVVERLEPMLSGAALERIRQTQFGAKNESPADGRLPGSQPEKKGRSAEHIAAVAGVSRSTIDAVQAIRKKGDSDLLEAVKSGEISIRAAAKLARKNVKSERACFSRKFNLKIGGKSVSVILASTGLLEQKDGLNELLGRIENYLKAFPAE